MKRELILKKCDHCGAMVEVMQDCQCADCGLICCGKPMRTIQSNSVDAAFEKHVPTYRRIENQLLVTVNHVMDEDHYIEWVALVTDNRVGKKFLQPGNSAEVLFPYVPNGTLYAYCNKHELWKKEIEQ